MHSATEQHPWPFLHFVFVLLMFGGFVVGCFDLVLAFKMSFIARDGSELLIFLLLPSKCWDYKFVLLYLAHIFILDRVSLSCPGWP